MLAAVGQWNEGNRCAIDISNNIDELILTPVVPFIVDRNESCIIKTVERSWYSAIIIITDSLMLKP